MIQHARCHLARRAVGVAIVLAASIQLAFADTVWQLDELERMTAAEDFHVVPYRDDHVTLGKPTRILPVAVDGELYVRAHEGARSSWYQAAVREHGGQITAAGKSRMVAFERVQGEINTRIDAAYRARYAAGPNLNAMLSERANATTMRIRPLGSWTR